MPINLTDGKWVITAPTTATATTTGEAYKAGSTGTRYIHRNPGTLSGSWARSLSEFAVSGAQIA